MIIAMTHFNIESLNIEKFIPIHSHCINYIKKKAFESTHKKNEDTPSNTTQGIFKKVLRKGI